VDREVPDVVQLEEVMIDDSLHQVETAPPHEQLAGERPPRWKSSSSLSVTQQQINADGGEKPDACVE
jgi:hypothetical protein